MGVAPFVMLTLGEALLGDRLRRVLCLGAHSDDLEIGCGGTVLRLIEASPHLEVDWVVLSASGPREDEAREGASRFLEGAGAARVQVEAFRERYFPYLPELKEWFDGIGRRLTPDLVLSPWTGDAHQDHRTVAELAKNTFRDHLVLEYEIPKLDGDLGRPSVYVNLPAETAQRKIDHILDSFPSQKERSWFGEETFRALMRLRGVESRSPSGLAEGFHCTKLVLA